MAHMSRWRLGMALERMRWRSSQEQTKLFMSLARRQGLAMGKEEMGASEINGPCGEETVTSDGECIY